MIFKLTLHSAYYKGGFFNARRDFDDLIRQDEGEITVSAGTEDLTFVGKVDRTANKNGTARIRNLKGFKQWLQKNYRQDDVLDVEIVAPNLLKIKTPTQNGGTNI
ncbi:hypothetical protein Dxin01_04012 [Deinococcus xinjiangensis]|uniref:Uncharacterized protein n=1 Tax=Deinococcus xinjiangensis TaxID=457454 RepID=A0ABP9VJG8_9DEIO